MLVSVYIRNENIDKWKALYNKSEWVNQQLNNSETYFETRVRKIVKQELESITNNYS